MARQSKAQKFILAKAEAELDTLAQYQIGQKVEFFAEGTAAVQDGVAGQWMPGIITGIDPTCASPIIIKKSYESCVSRAACKSDMVRPAQ